MAQGGRKAPVTLLGRDPRPAQVLAAGGENAEQAVEEHSYKNQLRSCDCHRNEDDKGHRVKPLFGVPIYFHCEVFISSHLHIRGV